MDLKQLHQLKCELLKVYRYQGLTLQELLCEFYSHINEVINSTNGLIDIVDYLVGDGLSKEVATHLNNMLIDGTFEKIITKKVNELSTNLNSQFNEMKSIIESNISESDKLIENLRVYDSRFNNIDTKNIEQDIRIKDIEYRNKVQDVYINGFFNENKSDRLTIEGEGNDLKLEGSKKGLVEVERIVGDTTVNIMPKVALSSSILKDNWITLNVTGVYDHLLHKGIFDDLLKVDTTYTIIINIKNNTLSDSIRFITGSNVPFTSSSNNLINPNVNGTMVFTVRTHSDLSSYLYDFWLSHSNTITGSIDIQISILEGDYTNKPIPNQYIEGLKSSFEENLVTQDMVEQGLEDAKNLGKYKVPVRIVGKNLFDKSKVKFVGIDTTNGLEVDNGYYSSDFIKIKPNTSYIRSQGSGIYYYDNDKNFIIFQSHSIKSPTNAFYCRIQLQKDWNLDTVQIEEGTVATNNEKYFERTTNVYLNSPHLKGDELVIHNGELCHYHRYIEGVYDGSSDESLDFYSPTLAVMFKGLKYIKKHYSNVKLVEATWESVNIFAYRLPTDSGVTNISQAREYLQSNPIKIVYKLAEPYYEPISSDKLLLECANDSTIHLDTIVPVESVKASYTGNIPNAYQMDDDISVTQTAVDFLLMSNVGEVMVMSFMNNTKSANNLGSYFANRIIKKALSYDDVINKYPQFKDDIDVILINEGYEYLIK